MPKHPGRGFLIVIEGIDGAGKTTQCDRLFEALRADGWKVQRFREPTDGPHGRRIREFARSGRDTLSAREELDLFIADRRENVRDHLLPALNEGAVVLLDRYYYSSMAYQGALGLNPDQIRAENEAFAPPADLLFYLRIPAELARERIESKRREERDLFEREEYLRKVQAIFDAMRDPQMVRIDASQGADTVFAEILCSVREFLSQKSR